VVVCKEPQGSGYKGIVHYIKLLEKDANHYMSVCCTIATIIHARNAARYPTHNPGGKSHSTSNLFSREKAEYQ
jgi:hypothetical protein